MENPLIPEKYPELGAPAGGIPLPVARGFPLPQLGARVKGAKRRSVPLTRVRTAAFCFGDGLRAQLTVFKQILSIRHPHFTHYECRRAENLYIADDSGQYADTKNSEGPLYSWVNFDEVGNDFTDYNITETDEVSDIKDVAHITYKGPSNLIEWYLSFRMLVDAMIADRMVSDEYSLFHIHGEALKNIPQFIRLGTDGTFNEVAENYGIDLDAVSVDGYNHMDVVSAAANRPDRENEVFMPLIDFVIDNTI